MTFVEAIRKTEEILGNNILFDIIWIEDLYNAKCFGDVYGCGFYFGMNYFFSANEAVEDFVYSLGNVVFQADGCMLIAYKDDADEI